MRAVSSPRSSLIAELRTLSRLRRLRPRSTARSMIDWVACQSKPSSFDAADIPEHTLITSTAMYSKRSVKRECLPAQGTGIVRTPHVLHLLRGTAAWIIVVNCIVSRCRHVRSGAMSACGQRFLHSGQSSFEPQYSMRISTSFASGIKSTFVTSQSASRPNKAL